MQLHFHNLTACIYTQIIIPKVSSRIVKENNSFFYSLHIAELLGFDDYIAPYAQARGRDILRGVNYASAAAGIREETGQQLVHSNKKSF